MPAPHQYTLRRTWPEERRENDFTFRWNGHNVGRTYLDPGGKFWSWSIYGINLRGPLPEGTQVQGMGDTLDATKILFKMNWEKLIAGGSTRL
jgi:hypothetical protein